MNEIVSKRVVYERMTEEGNGERTPFFMGLQTNIFFNGIHLAELPRILRGTFTKGGLMTGDHC